MGAPRGGKGPPGRLFIFLREEVKATMVINDSGREDLHNLLAQFIERKIRTRAHELYEARGKAGGYALEDWLRSEAEVWGQVKPVGRSEAECSQAVPRRAVS